MRAILTFHSIDEKDSVISCSPRYFSMLLDALAAKDIPVLDLDTLVHPDTRRGVAITFDDGMQSVCRNALPVLRDHGATAHVFVATGAIEGADRWPADDYSIPDYDMLNWDELATLHEAGIAIESHTHSHPDMRTLSAQQMLDDCERADILIRERLGRRPAWFAYPYGYHNQAVRDFARNRYRGTVTTELRPLGAREDSAALPRLDSYYLRSDWRIRHFDTLPVTAYLATRNFLRNIRGSQCAAGCD
jgi:peptidoglycan/xylan/chitin deacetylase (PgdA/CDA1 family)